MGLSSSQAICCFILKYLFIEVLNYYTVKQNITLLIATKTRTISNEGCLQTDLSQ